MSPLKRTARASAKQRPRGAHAKPPAPRVVADVPVELQTADYEFPHVQLPEHRPHPSALELHDALADDDTLVLDGVVVDPEPKPVHVVGLEPVAAPVIPAPDTQSKVAALEAAILGRPAPAAVPVPVARHRKPGVQHSFGDRFWRDVQALVDRAHAVAETLTAANDRMQTELADRLDRLERAHMDAVTQTNAAPLPRRIPGRALAAIEASRGELVSQ